MLRDEIMFPIPTPLIEESAEEANAYPAADEHPSSYANNDFDDVFGSAPSSPTLHPAASSDLSYRHRESELSDIPRLREKHETEGYRDGVTQGKAQSIQAGFDEGYSLGAVLGLRVGRVLGLLEGIARAVDGLGGGEGRKEEMEMWEKAEGELMLEKVFGREFWGEDGVWKFDVPGEKDGEGGVVFEMVADAHPLVKRWMEVVGEECLRWGIDLEVWEGEGERDGEEEKHKGKLGKGVGEVDPASEASGRIMGVKKEQLNW